MGSIPFTAPHLLIGAYWALNFYQRKPSVIKTALKLAISDVEPAPCLQPGHSPSSRNSANLAFIPLGGHLVIHRKAGKIRQFFRFVDFIMRNQEIAPRFAAVCLGVCSGVFAPFDGSGAFRPHFRGFQIRARFDFRKPDGVSGFHDEIGDVFAVFRAELVIDLELSFGGFEPFFGIAFQNNGEAAFGIGIEFLPAGSTMSHWRVGRGHWRGRS